jgi:hypothetical protein
MNGFLKRMRRRLAVGLLGLSLVVAPPAYEQAVRAQDAETPEPGSGSGRPLDGYLGTVVLVLLAFFIVGKSARR